MSTLKILTPGSGVVFLEKLSSEVTVVGGGLLHSTLNLLAMALVLNLVGLVVGFLLLLGLVNILLGGVLN